MSLIIAIIIALAGFYPMTGEVINQSSDGFVTVVSDDGNIWEYYDDSPIDNNCTLIMYNNHTAFVEDDIVVRRVK